MPLYEYRCGDCHQVFELLRPMAARDQGAECPGCHSAASMPLISRAVAINSAVVASTPAGAGGGCCGGSCGCN
ncbi:MAG: FmdB family zinc ribbon protein [Candidatus Dormibacteria bacterium]